MSNRSLKCSVRKRFTGSTADGVESVMYCLWLTLLLNFFFSSRRRHTRGNCDWSSDVCSSDLAFEVPVAPAESLFVETAGRGDPVVIIPGLFGAAFGFRKLVPLLAASGYRAIVIEPLGIGSSGRPEKANYSLTAQADRIAAVLDSLHVVSAWLIAHSIGGSEAFRLAYRRPDLVRGLVSIEG